LYKILGIQIVILEIQIRRKVPEWCKMVPVWYKNHHRSLGQIAILEIQKSKGH
jgi:hypothetical protein